MKLNKDDRREEMAAYGTILLTSVVVIYVIYAIFSNL